jgi:hypothetical protein
MSRRARTVPRTEAGGPRAAQDRPVTESTCRVQAVIWAYEHGLVAPSRATGG